MRQFKGRERDDQKSRRTEIEPERETNLQDLVCHLDLASRAPRSLDIFASHAALLLSRTYSLVLHAAGLVGYLRRPEEGK